MQTDTTERPTPTRDRTEPSVDDADRPDVTEGEAAATDDVAEAPGWFRTKPSTPSAAGGSSPPRLRSPGPKRTRIVTESGPAPVEETDWRRRAVQFITGAAGTGYGLSLLLHTLLLVALGMYVFDLSLFGAPGETELGFTEDDGSAFDFGADDSIHQEAGGRDAAEEVPVEPVPVSQLIADQGDPVEEMREQFAEALAADVPSTGAGEGIDQGDGTAEQASGGRKIGSNAVQSEDGTFTVYVTPARPLEPGEKLLGFDPEPGENYFTYIKIAIPDDLDHILFKDVKGRIVGTDGWETNIPYDRERRNDKRNGGPQTIGTPTQFYNPGSRGVDFPTVNEYHIERNRRIPITTQTIDGERRRFATLRLTIGTPQFLLNGRVYAREGIKDTIEIECEPLNRKAKLEVEF